MTEIHNTDVMILRDICENNLKHIDIEIPKEKIVMFTGISGSGKSSLVFDTIAAESIRQMNASYPLYIRNRMPRYERPNAGEMWNLAPAVVIDQKPLGGNPHSTVGTATDIAPLIRLLFSRAGEPQLGAAIDFSMNSPMGLCSMCNGFGERLMPDAAKILDLEKSLKEGAIRFKPFSPNNWQGRVYLDSGLFDNRKKLSAYTKREMDLLLYGIDAPTKVPFKSKNAVLYVDYEGLIPRFERLYINRDVTKLKQVKMDEILSFVKKAPCRECQGTGLNPKLLASKIDGNNIADYGAMQLTDLLAALRQVRHLVGAPIAEQAAGLVKNMIDMGLGYLTLSRKVESLSGGEAQRLKLVRSLGSSLNNMTYIFDEPCTGLHPQDIEQLKRILVQLRDRHNNVLVVTHHMDLLAIADQIIELGPSAGSAGGQVVFQGDLEHLKQTNTQTARAMREFPRINSHPRTWIECYSIRNACMHNLKHLDVDIPKGVLTAVTGVAGAGKSTLICGELVERFPEAVVISQAAIGTSSRSTPATYIGVMDSIREVFAKENGVELGLFSFNSTGACPVCHGKGELTPDVAFADPVAIPCESCGGTRYSQEALSHKYHGKTIVDVLRMTAEDALDFFDNQRIRRKLERLIEVGLGYVELGQSTDTMSGGETQRLKLADELSRRGNLYILDEPSTGLHPADVVNLFALLNQIVDAGNTVVVIDHHPNLIAACDWIIDLGPEGGTNGGRLLFTGTPEQLLETGTSPTAQWLKRVTQDSK